MEKAFCLKVEGWEAPVLGEAVLPRLGQHPGPVGRQRGEGTWVTLHVPSILLPQRGLRVVLGLVVLACG